MPIITAKYAGSCPICEREIKVGERIFYNRGEITRHAACDLPLMPKHPFIFDADYSCGVGEVVRNPYPSRPDFPAWLKVLMVEREYISAKRAEDEDDFAHTGGGNIYIHTCREATAAEAASEIEAAAKLAAEAEILKTARTKLEKIFERISSQGSKPEGRNDAEGEEFYLSARDEAMRIHGLGRWLVVGTAYIWAITNNGDDGDDWARSNVNTCGAGAIGYRVKRSDGLVAEIRQAAMDGAPTEEEQYYAYKNSPLGKYVERT